MRKIAVFTGTRAEYGLLYWLLKDIQSDLELELQLIVSGMHLSPEFGDTHQQIVRDGFHIDETVEMLLSSDTAVGVVKSMGLGMIGYADALSRLKPDAVVVLGDRFEALAISQAAMIMRLPILHIHGGEVTEGAYDDAIRHAITKLSDYHCTSTELHRQRVIQLGELPERVTNVGAIGLDYLHRQPLLSLETLSDSLDFALSSPYFLVTYHPCTLSADSASSAFQALLDSLDQFQDHQVVLTYSNADDGGREIIAMIERYASQHPQRVLATPSLGQLRYLSAMKHCQAVVGNSSSGLIEAPSFSVPTVNIGERQKGRTCADSVLHTDASYASITDAIQQAIAPQYRAFCQSVDNPYGSGNAVVSIIKVLKAMQCSAFKPFYDLPGVQPDE